MKKSIDEVQIAVIAEKVENIEKAVEEIKKKLEADFVTKAEFMPVRNIAYGLVTLVLTSVVGALLALVLRK